MSVVKKYGQVVFREKTADVEAEARKLQEECVATEKRVTAKTQEERERDMKPCFGTAEAGAMKIWFVHFFCATSS